jgi:hypothetical protein
MTCQHKWVLYQPFQGDPYKCCANAGCGIKYDDYLASGALNEFPHALNQATTEEHEWIANFRLDASGQIVKTKEANDHKHGWYPVDLKDYLCPILPPGSKL